MSASSSIAPSPSRYRTGRLMINSVAVTRIGAAASKAAIRATGGAVALADVMRFAQASTLVSLHLGAKRGSGGIRATAEVRFALELPTGRRVCSHARQRNRLESSAPAGNKEDAMRRLPAAGLFMIAALVAAAPAVTAKTSSTPTNVDVSQRHLNESEEAIAVNPTNPNNIVIVTNVGHREAGLSAGMFEGISFDGGKTWATKLIVANTNNWTYGDISIGPAGQIMQVCTLTESGQGGGKLFVNVDPDGLGPANFGGRIFVTDTHVGGFDFIPPQPGRSVDAEPGLAWDR